MKLVGCRVKIGGILYVSNSWDGKLKRSSIDKGVMWEISLIELSNIWYRTDGYGFWSDHENNLGYEMNLNESWLEHGGIRDRISVELSGSDLR